MGPSIKHVLGVLEWFYLFHFFFLNLSFVWNWPWKRPYFCREFFCTLPLICNTYYVIHIMYNICIYICKIVMIRIRLMQEWSWSMDRPRSTNYPPPPGSQDAIFHLTSASPAWGEWTWDRNTSRDNSDRKRDCLNLTYFLTAKCPAAITQMVFCILYGLHGSNAYSACFGFRWRLVWI